MPSIESLLPAVICRERVSDSMIPALRSTIRYWYMENINARMMIGTSASR